MSELQGPRIPGEERSGRRRPLGWIIGGLLALLLLALLIPFACQALGGGADSQGQGSGAQGKAVAQEADDDGRDGGGAGENAQAQAAQAERAGGEGSQAGKDAAVEADGGGGSGAEGGAESGAQDGAKTPSERGEPRTGGELPETGGMSPAAMLVVGMLFLLLLMGLMGTTGLFFAVVRRGSASRG